MPGAAPYGAQGADFDFFLVRLLFIDIPGPLSWLFRIPPVTIDCLHLRLESSPCERSSSDRQETPTPILMTLSEKLTASTGSVLFGALFPAR